MCLSWAPNPQKMQTSQLHMQRGRSLLLQKFIVVAFRVSSWRMLLSTRLPCLKTLDQQKRIQKELAILHERPSGRSKSVNPVGPLHRNVAVWLEEVYASLVRGL